MAAEVKAARAEARQQGGTRSEGSVLRSVFRRVLVALGYLVLKWRRIPTLLAHRHQVLAVE
jgi:hypothetical protein